METTAKNNTSGTHQEKAKKLRKLRRWQIAVSLLGAAIVVWGVIEVVCLFLDYKQTEVSNDAQIEQYISPINLRASGYIKKIYFTEHQEVRKGDTLLVLDDREYKIRVMEAEAALKDAQAGATVIGATLPYTTRADRNGIRSYPQKAGSYKTATESSLVGRKRGITPPRKYGSRHSAGNGRFGDGTPEPLLHRSDSSLRRQIGTPCLGRRPVHYSRTNHHLHSARHSKMDCRQLQRDTSGEPAYRTRGSHHRRRHQ